MMYTSNLYPRSFHTHGHFVPMVVSYPRLFCSHGCFVSSHFIPKFSQFVPSLSQFVPKWLVHSYLSQYTFLQNTSHASTWTDVDYVYDKLVEPSNQDLSKVLLRILATLLAQDKCDIFNEPVYCLHFWLSWQ